MNLVEKIGLLCGSQNGTRSTRLGSSVEHPWINLLTKVFSAITLHGNLIKST
jgi:hypothetical protein